MADLAEAVNKTAPLVEEGTILRIVATFENESEGLERTSNVAAVYASNRWYLTGEDRALGRHYASTADLLLALARAKSFTMELASQFETIR